MLSLAAGWIVARVLGPALTALAFVLVAGVAAALMLALTLLAVALVLVLSPGLVAFALLHNVRS